MTKIQTILQNSGYAISQDLFANREIEALEARIIESNSKGKTTFAVECLKRGKPVRATPEEVVRQLYLAKLLTQYKYPKDRIQVEYPVSFGSDNSKRADIVVTNAERPDAVYILVELKKPNSKAGKDQLKSYCHATGSPMGVWTNGYQIEHYLKKDPNIFEPIPDIPTSAGKLADVLNQPFTILDLMKRDILKTKSLRRVIEEFEDEVLANAGVDVFEEAFKLIFAKLYDESKSGKDKDKLAFWLEQDPANTADNIPETISKKFRNLEFRNTGVETDTKDHIDQLFEDAKGKWKGIFPAGATIELTSSHLQTCVSYLENVKLFNSNLEVVDDAFEYLVNKDAKGDKGQYFTPRYVIDMCVKMLNPQPDEPIIDTAAGSCGFPVHSIFHVWQQLNPSGRNLFTTTERTPEQTAYVREKVFALDFDAKTVRVGRTLNLIAGDGETNVLQLNSLDYERWKSDFYDNPDWRKVYGKGFENLEGLQSKKKDYRYFDFTVLMANPPFAGDIKDARVIRRYELAKKLEEKVDPKTGHKLSREKGWQDKVSRDILFVERNLDMLRPGGRMAIVLPQGRFNNSSEKQLRQYIAGRARLLAVVGLHPNSFKPHTGTKTSVLFVQKWNTDQNAGPLCPPVANYPIFFATQQKEGKNNSGEKLYWSRTPGQTTTHTEDAILDEHGHPIGWHDLFSVNTDDTDMPRTPEGVAEAFQLFAAKEKFSFFR